MFKSFAAVVTSMLMVGSQANEVVDGVTILNEFSFWDAVNANDYLFVYFYRSLWYVRALLTSPQLAMQRDG